MAVTITPSPAVPKVDQTTTLTIAGATALTSYILRIVHPGGGTETHKITTDGGGGATQTYVAQEGGAVTYNLDPVATATGTTCSATGTHGH